MEPCWPRWAWQRIARTHRPCRMRPGLKQPLQLAARSGRRVEGLKKHPRLLWRRDAGLMRPVKANSAACVRDGAGHAAERERACGQARPRQHGSPCHPHLSNHTAHLPRGHPGSSVRLPVFKTCESRSTMPLAGPRVPVSAPVLPTATPARLAGDSAFPGAGRPLERLIAVCEVGGEPCLLGQVDSHVQHAECDPLLEPVLVNTQRRR